MNLLIYGLAIATLVSTLIGGIIILRFKKSLPYFFAFSAGSIIAVAFLDILPESIETGAKIGVPIRTIMLIVVGSFFFYGLLEKFFATHDLKDGEEHGHVMGPIGAGSLVIHSFLDGAAIGIAFQINASVGLVVALAVILHDMTDGLNTVVVMLKNKQRVKKAVAFLLMDALAPVLGLIVTSLILLPEELLVYVLSFFVGEFIYIGAGTLLPETRNHPPKRMIASIALGILLIVFLTSLI